MALSAIISRYGSLISIAAALGLGWAWLAARDARQREAGRAEVLAGQLDSVAAHHDSVAVDRQRQDSVQRAEIARLDSRYRTAVARFAQASQVSESLAVALDTHLAGDTTVVGALMRETVAAYQTEVAACSLAVTDCEAIRVRQDSVIQRQDSSLTDLRGLYEATERALQVERKRARPGLLRRVEMALPMIAVTGVVVFLATR